MTSPSSEEPLIIEGTIKWFDRRKGYGFVTPTSDNSPTTADIFLHQTSVAQIEPPHRSPLEGWRVEFQVIHDTDGKLKAVEVTGPGGAPCTGPSRPRRRRGTKSSGEDHGEDHEGGSRRRRNPSENPPKPPPPKWHEGLLDASVQAILQQKAIPLDSATLTVALSNQEVRCKLGSMQYAALVNRTANLIAEGSFACTVEGNVTCVWERVLHWPEGDVAWTKVMDDVTTLPGLVHSFSLVSDAVTSIENPLTSFWGPDVPKARDALESNDFALRQVNLVTRGRRRRPPPHTNEE